MSPADTVTVHIRRDTRERLMQLSQKEGITAVELLDRLVQEHEDAQFLARFGNRDAETFAGLGAADVAVWDPTLMDGLDPAEDFSAWR